MALQSLFLGLSLIAHPARRSQANLALAGTSIAFALSMVENILRYWGGDVPRSDYVWVGWKLPILFIPPFAYLHIVGLTSGPGWRFTLRDSRHGLFCIAACLLFAVAVTLKQPRLVQLLHAGIYLVTVLQGGYYLWDGLRRTRRGGSPQIAWLRLLLLGLASLLVLFAAINGASALLGDLPWARLLAHFSAIAVLYGIGWASLTHGSAFQKPPEQVFRSLAAPLDKYRKSRQSAQEAGRILAKLDHAILSECLYREAGLTLPMLAAKVGAKPNVVSQALNQTLGLNFFDYINDRRIAEAQRMLAAVDDEGNTILDIAYAVGFNSKSTFNAAFKKRTGETPSLFRKRAAASTRL